MIASLWPLEASIDSFTSPSPSPTTIDRPATQEQKGIPPHSATGPISQRAAAMAAEEEEGSAAAAGGGGGRRRSSRRSKGWTSSTREGLWAARLQLVPEGDEDRYVMYCLLLLLLRQAAPKPIRSIGPRPAYSHTQGAVALGLPAGARLLLLRQGGGPGRQVLRAGCVDVSINQSSDVCDRRRPRSQRHGACAHSTLTPRSQAATRNSTRPARSSIRSPSPTTRCWRATYG